MSAYRLLANRDLEGRFRRFFKRDMSKDSADLAELDALLESAGITRGQIYYCNTHPKSKDQPHRLLVKAVIEEKYPEVLLHSVAFNKDMAIVSQEKETRRSPLSGGFYGRGASPNVDPSDDDLYE